MSDNPEPGGVSPANGSPPNQTPSKASSQRDDVRSTVEESNASSDQGLSEAGDKHANTAPTGLATETVEDRRGPRGVRGWLSDLFSDEPEDLPELMEILRDAAQRELLDTDALNIIFGALHVADMHARDIMIPRSSLVVVGEHQDPQQLLATNWLLCAVIGVTDELAKLGQATSSSERRELRPR